MRGLLVDEGSTLNLMDYCLDDGVHYSVQLFISKEQMKSFVKNVGGQPRQFSSCAETRDVLPGARVAPSDDVVKTEVLRPRVFVAGLFERHMRGNGADKESNSHEKVCVRLTSG